ncbi:hypothetical protein OV079_36470 [Nannocystis pusilla]|uniref:Uncharacterized protein n=1 Tax=Nannocystis pusilla TaxID=889268 RepID=A0A9X3EWT9_9BACT|nr:hypothetical protein [Nannocystis pusilla]MCY1010970.1 hypothetical protein [Nannocystis pusilla]
MKFGAGELAGGLEAGLRVRVDLDARAGIGEPGAAVVGQLVLGDRFDRRRGGGEVVGARVEVGELAARRIDVGRRHAEGDGGFLLGGGRRSERFAAGQRVPAAEQEHAAAGEGGGDPSTAAREGV